MDSEKVIQDLTRRFAAPLPEFYSRRIIFWHGSPVRWNTVKNAAPL